MSTAVWPLISSEELAREEGASQARELEWLLTQLQETLKSLKEGLEECAALLAPRSENASILVLSSLRSESLKGLVTRVGTRIVKGVRTTWLRRAVKIIPLTSGLQNIKLRLSSLPPPRGSPCYELTISSAPQAPTLVIEQLTSVRTLINACLDVIDVTTWTGDAKNANFIAGQFQLLFDNIQEAKNVLKGYSDVRRPWWEDAIDEQIFDPPLPHNVSFHLSIFDAALRLELRTLEIHNSAEESHSGFSIRNTLAVALGGARPPTHDEADRTFTYKGQEVRVKEKITVESQDPSLISTMSKLSALEHHVALSRKALSIVMGKDE